jgi:large subunit ribosomal protein L4
MELNLAPSGSMQVNDAVFSVDFNPDLIHQVVTAYRANARQATKAQKTRSDVRGGGRKPWRQKGTGRARAGTSRSPLWRGGGVTFAAKDRNYTQKVNRKMYQAAIRSIVSELYRRDALIVIPTLDVADHKTKNLRQQLLDLNLTQVLIVTDEVSQNLHFASRNIPHVEVMDVNGTNPLDLVSYEKVLFTEAAIKQLEERLV